MRTSHTHSANQNEETHPSADRRTQDTGMMPQRWMIERRVPDSAKPVPMVNANQQTSINAMISYVAHKLGQSEFGIERLLADHFNIPNVTLLRAGDFDAAIRYLADMIAA